MRLDLSALGGELALNQDGLLALLHRLPLEAAGVGVGLPVGVALAGLLFGLAALAGWRRGGTGGAVLRVLALAGVVLAGLPVRYVREETTPLADVAVVVVDDSPSVTRIPERLAQQEAVRQTVRTALAAFPDLEVREIRAGGSERDARLGETRLLAAWQQAVADIPRRRLAATFLLSDGQVHDAPAAPGPEWAAAGPFHLLLLGQPVAVDRWLEAGEVPAFGLVGKTVPLALTVHETPVTPRSGSGPDPDSGAEAVMVTVRQDGNLLEQRSVTVGQETTFQVPVPHAGPILLEADVTLRAGEMTPLNNRVALVVNGVRDRLRVLLISGEPHPGERVWRNLLKADPGVDLVHFTVLRPPEKHDATPLRDVSLIAFPTRELFEVKLREFDLVIFDRYRRRGLISNAYLENIVRYVEAGGALLEASGVVQPLSLGLFRTPLAGILPGVPDGEVVEGPFRPRLTREGRAHPVTRALPGAGPEAGDPTWGAWYSQMRVRPESGTVVMRGADDEPLLILNRVGKGRVAQLTSDQIWLWSRNFDGGGPHVALLRRLSHWLMKEPELEEDALQIQVDGSQITVFRQLPSGEGGPVGVTTPLGNTETLLLQPRSDGEGESGVWKATEAGLYRFRDGPRQAVAVVGMQNPPEMARLDATAQPLQPLLAATGGGVAVLAQTGVPELRQRSRDQTVFADAGWLGLRRNQETALAGVRETPLVPVSGLVLLAIVGLLWLWRRESR